MRDPFDFSGRTVFVAGGSSGINLGIAEGFAARGANVGILARDPGRIEAAVETLRGHGVDAVGASADVRDYGQVESALRHAHQRFGDFDVLVSGAAGNFVAPALGMSSNGFKAVMDIDLLGTFNVMRAAHQFLRRPGASVVNISAGQSSRPYVFQAHVCAAKAGIDQLTRVLAMEWGPQGIRVNAVSPGPIEGTEGMRRLTPTPEAEERSKRGIPLGRWGKKQEIADACLFLSSPMAAYITGIVLPVDGGSNLGGSPTLGDPALTEMFGKV